MDFLRINYTCIHCGIELIEIEKAPLKCPGCDKCPKCEQQVKVIRKGVKKCGCKTYVA